MVLTSLGIALTLFALIWTIYGVFSNRKIEKKIISEKDMILDRVLDIKRSLQDHLDKIAIDRKNQNDQTLNTINIREEDIKAMKDNIERFEERLKKIK